MGDPLDDIPEPIKQFIFANIDSVEQLEVLFICMADPKREWNAEGLSAELRSNPSSIQRRLKALEASQLIKRSPSLENAYIFEVPSKDVDQLLKQLYELYQTRRHRVLELVFSPLKKARDFADAFRLRAKEASGGEDA